MSAPEPLVILHLDERVVVVAKPAGLLVHRTQSGSGEEALLQRLRDQLGQRVFPVQRLDRWASGLVAFGLDPEATADLQAGLQAPAALKEYLVLARGACPRRFECRAPLVDDKDVARTAHTTFARLAFLPGLPASLLRARLHTGRYHQIRRHLALLGHHVVGDSRYGKARTNRAAARLGLTRLFLHAWRLAVPRPELGPLAVRAPLAADLRGVLARLRGAQGVPGGPVSPVSS
ncbi:MAG TPA: pseudouridine synthase [Planctomycetota bacterium]